MNLFLQLHGDLGIPIHARALAEEVVRIAPEARVIPLRAAHPWDRALPPAIRSRVGPPVPGRPAFAFWHPSAYDDLLAGFPRRLGYFVFEYTKIPAALIPALDRLDVLATPSRWGAEVLRANGVRTRIEVVRAGIDGERFPVRPRPPGEGAGPFRFLHVGKLERRKGADLLVRAYLQAFAGRSDVALTLSVNNPEIRGLDPAAWLREEFDLHPGQHGVRLQPPVPDMAALYASHHCAVFPTRGEGVGLPIVEAITSGLPTIVTRTSGTTEYVSEQICFPLTRLRKVDVHDPHYFPQPGLLGQWDEPDVDELAEAMVRVRARYRRALEVGRAGAAWMREHFRWSEPAARLVELLRPPAR